MSRKMRDSAKAKLLPEKRLDAMLEKLGADFITEPRWAQKVSYLLAWKHQSYVILMGMGGGKTKLSLDLFRNRRLKGQVTRMLVLVPYTTNLGTWRNENRKHAPDCTLEILDGNGRAERWDTVEGQADIVAMTYQGMTSLVTKKDDRETTKAKKRATMLDEKAVRRLVKQFDMVVCDESSMLMGHASLYFRLVKRFQKKTDYIIQLTGTPFDKDPAALWTQFFLADKGYTLGETLGLFRAGFFREEESHWAITHVFRRRLKSTLHRRLRHSSIRFTEDECQDLPDSMGGISDPNGPMELRVQMPAETARYYSRVRKEWDDATRSGDLVMKANAYYRMRMLASGWLGMKDEDDETVQVTFKQNPKVDVVLDFLKELPENEKVIVVHDLNHTGQIVHDAFKKAKLKFMWIYGKSTKKSKATLEEVFTDPKGPRVLLASSAIAYGVNLQSAALNMIFLETPNSVIKRKQLERRILRAEGLPGKRKFWDILMDDTKDDEILEGLVKGVALLDGVVDG